MDHTKSHILNQLYFLWEPGSPPGKMTPTAVGHHNNLLMAMLSKISLLASKST